MKDYFYSFIYSILGILFLLFSQITFANYFGTSVSSDNYSWVIGTATILFGFASNSFKTSITPFIHRYNIGVDNIYISIFWFYIYFLVIQVVCVLIFYFNLDFILEKFTKFDFSRRNDLYRLFFALIPFLFINGLTSINIAVLSSFSKYRKQFFVQNIINPLLLILIIFTFHLKYGIYAVILGNTLGILFVYFSTLHSIIKLFKFNNPKKIILNEIVSFIKFDYYYKLIYLVSFISDITQKYLLSGLNIGSSAYINYADKVVKLSDVTLNSSISPIILTELSKKSKFSKDIMFDSYTKYFNILSFLIIPISTLSFFVSKHIVSFLFFYGNFSIVSVENTNVALKALIFSIIPTTLLVLNNKMYAALNDSKTGLYISLPFYILYGFIYFLFAKYFGFTGLCLATTFNATISLIISTILLKYKHFNFSILSLLKNFIKYLILSIFIFSIFSYFFIDFENIYTSKFYNLFNISLISFGLLIYLYASYLIKDSIALEIINYLQIKIFKYRNFHK